MSNRLFQGVIHQMKDAIDRVIGVIDENGVIIACSELVKIGEIRQGKVFWSNCRRCKNSLRRYRRWNTSDPGNF